MSPIKKIKKPSDKPINREIQLSQAFPITLLIGDFELTVDQFTSEGWWDAASKVFKGVSGTAWLKLDCAGPAPVFDLLERPIGYRQIKASLEVVQRATNSETEISLPDAYLLDPDIHVGQTLEINVAATSPRFHDLARSTEGIIKTLHSIGHRGDILVSFKRVTIERLFGRKNSGRITQGEVTFPADSPCPREIRFLQEGFTILISELVLRPAGAKAEVTLILPDSIASTDTCNPARLSLGKIDFAPDCNLYVDRPNEDYGPWLIGDTGMIVSGRGYTVDLSKAASPGARPADWMGMILRNGTASGSPLNPLNSNTGFLAGQYRFSEVLIMRTGFQGQLDLSVRHAFQPVHPQGYVVSMDAGNLSLIDSRIVFGQLGPGTVRLPSVSVCQRTPGNQIDAKFSTLTVRPNLDLWGEVLFKPGLDFCWGELTHPGNEQINWCLNPLKGRLYLPANPILPFCPDDGIGFIDLALSDIEAKGVAGITIYDMEKMQIFSLDRPDGTASPIVLLQRLKGWLHVGHKGIDGEILARPILHNEMLGNTAHSGYVGNSPFSANIISQEKSILLAQYAASAVYDSHLDGTLSLPEPCNIPALAFKDMELTSTAHLVGGDIVLPVGGVCLNYWKLQLVPTGDSNQAGVVSVRTGRLVFTAAGISETIHFAMPFKLTWGEILADGNLGELFLDYNNYGQKFDKLPYTPQNMILSKYIAGRTDGYLATCGTVHFNFFGVSFVNIKDARNDARPSAPWYRRYVTVPQNGEPSCAPTDLTLHGRVDNTAGDILGVFDFPDITMDYYEAAQNGFCGNGASELSMLHSGSMESQIEIHSDATDIRIASSSNHDLDFGFYRAGTLGDIAGCVRFEGPLLTRISIWAALEQSSSAGFGILAPKGGYSVEVNLDITPTSLNFYAAGNIVYSVAGSAVDIAANVHLLVDYMRRSAEGEISGSLDCNSILGGLEGSGQITWYVDAGTQYLQGRLKMSVCGWAGGAGLEGGLFIGNNCPRDKAWVLLHTSSEHFGVSRGILPESLTGLYGYGYVSFGINWYIFGGEIELFAGLGAFSGPPLGGTSAWGDDWSSNPTLGLPYVVGSGGIYVSGEILGGLVSASAWANLDLYGPAPIYFEGTFGLKGCVLWVLCASIEVTAGFNSSGFYLN